MEAKLFTETELEKYLLEIVFHGPSFDGVMEIDALAKEIQGLEDILKSSIHALKRHKKIEYGVNDYVIYVAAFEKSSFKKRIVAFNKTTGEFQPLIELSVLLLLLLQTVATYKPDEIKNISPELVSQIRNDVAIELLQDEKFIKSTAAIVQSVQAEGDSCKFVAADKTEFVVTPEVNEKIQQLAEPKEEAVDGEFYEILPGRVSKVDLDASRRHIGFKYNGEGETIDATFEEKPDVEVLKSLLGAQVEIKGTVSYVGGNRRHVDIQEYSILSQGQINLPEQQ